MSAYPELRPCVDCLRVTRPNNHKADEYPFPTVSRGNSERCCTCYEQARKPAPTPATDPEHAQTMRGYLRYLAGRQQRLAGVARR